MKNKIIFIGGCGRSGTTWLGESLSSSSVTSLISEKQNIFYRSRLCALNSSLEAEFLPLILKYYENKISTLDNSMCFIDKSHTNIWFLEKLLSNIENSAAILIYRDPFDTVSSMLRHEKVMQPMQEWFKYPIPNRFLGIGGIASVSDYIGMNLIIRCVIRWISHYQRVKAIEVLCLNKVVTVKYEHFTKQAFMKKKLKKIIPGELDFSSFTNSSIGKSRTNLTVHQRKQVRDVLSKYCKAALTEFPTR